MKRIILFILTALPFICSNFASAQTSDSSSKYSLKPNRPLVFTDKTEYDKFQNGNNLQISFDQKVTFEYLPSRRALTGEMCAINKIINTVDVGSGQKDLDHILNDDLDDYAEFITTAKVGVAYNPIVSVRDNSCYYAQGTTAGFSIVAGSGSTVLSLDVIGLMSITFYRDGEIVGHSAIKEGQEGSGVKLALVNIPGTDQTSVNLTATAPEIFDEISLDYDGVTVGVGNLIRIKYAFVGDAKTFTITRNAHNGSLPGGADNNNDYTPYEGFLMEKNGINLDNLDDATYQKYHVGLDYAKGWNPVLLGLPFPIVQSQLDNMLDDELTNTVPLTPVLGLAYMGGVKFMMKYVNDEKKEVYNPGTEVGFSYLNAAVLNLELGSSIQIILFDRNGKEIQTENLSAGVLALGVGQGGNGTASIISKVPFSGAEIRFYGGLKVDVGGMGVYYGFISEPPSIRHHCPLSPSANMSLCEEQESIQLNSNPDIAVTWSLGRFFNIDGDEMPNPARISSSGYVSNLIQPGQYEFIVTAADGCSDSVWINYDMFPDEVETAGDPLVNGSDEEDAPIYEISKSHNGESSGGLLIIDHLEDADNVIGDVNEAARYVGGLKLADNNLIVGVKRTNGDIVNYKRDREGKIDEGSGDESLYNGSKGNRVGFVFSNAVVGLNVGALHFMNIRLFKDGVEVYRHVVDESNIISAGLAGQDNQTRMRYSILVPWTDNNGKGVDFDEIQLWSSGVLDLGGGEMDIYYAFIERDVLEDEENKNIGSLSCSTTILSSSTTHTTIDYAAFGNPSLVKALGAMENISFIVDDDLESSFDDVHTAGVAARTTIPILLGRTLDFRNEIGVVMRSDTYLAGVDLGKGLTVYTMYRGEETGDKFTDWNVLGADVAGYGDKNIFYIHPTRLYDEVVIDYGQGVELVGKTQFFGLVMRSDSDGDGVPDCQDPNSCDVTITIFDVEDVCAGDEITIYAQGTEGAKYYLQFNDEAVEEIINPETGNDGSISYSYKTVNPGRYQVAFLNHDLRPIGAKMYEVHPLRTEWKADAANTDWNNWNNWTDGSPYCCTDVIIPDNAKCYPVLSGENTKGDEFCCNRIFIRPGASIEGVNRLNYVKAWVQLELDPNCYNLLSAPLHEMVTGDMFIPAEDKGFHNPEPFTDLTNEVSKENRFNPTIYQRMWNSVVWEQPWKDDLYEMKDMENITEFKSTTWSRNFNHVATPYLPMQGFSLWVDNGNLPDDTSFRFTFPKEHVVYNYFEDFSQTQVRESEKIERDNEKIGRFIYEDSPTRLYEYTRTDDKYVKDRHLFDLEEGLSTELTPEKVKEDDKDIYYALFGNPFMSHINSRKFIKENADAICGIMNQSGSLVFDPISGEFTSTGAPELLPPMSSVFLKMNTQDKASVHLTSDMILPITTVDDETSTDSKGITIQAVSNGMTSSVAILIESDITNAALIDSEVKTDFAIFSNVNSVACDIVTARSEVPITIIADKDAEITLNFFTNGVNRDDWTLFDKATGLEYPFDHSVTLPAGVGSSSGRFVLRSSSISAVEEVKEESDLYLEVVDKEVTAVSLAGKITSVEAFSLSGAMIAKAESADSNRLSITLPEGLCVVRVTVDGKSSSHKLMIR